MTIDTSTIHDDAFLRRVTTEATFGILEENTPLLVALSDRSRHGGRVGPWPPDKEHPLSLPLGTTRLARIALGPPKLKASADANARQLQIPETGGLWLRLKGLEKCELLSSTILMPDGFPEPTAISLNHAFTLLSREYEKHRISNTGNVYTRVFYQDRDKCWYPLDDLRRGVQVKAERALLNELWAEIEKALGWRPVSIPGKGRRKKTGS